MNRAARSVQFLVVIPSKNAPNRFEDPFQSETLPAGGDRECRLLNLSYPTKERQCEAPLAGHDDDRRHHQWFPLSSHARARRSKKPLAQSEPEDARSCGRKRGRRRYAGDLAVGRGTGIQGAGRSAEGSRGRAEGAGVVVGHYAHRAQRLDTLDHLRQAARDSRASDRQRLCDARCREAARLLLRSVWDL